MGFVIAPCCNEPCRNLATCYYEPETGGEFMLCDTCRDAFWLGQANGGAIIYDLNTGVAVMESEREQEGGEQDA